MSKARLSGQARPLHVRRDPRKDRIGLRGAFYLGDMPDDMMAARRSRTGYKGVGVALPAVDQEGPLAAELSAAGVDHIIRSYPELRRLVDPG
jgi:phosphoglycolate phosphatase-like HAD superfamily hydrolase